jgi:hypothetical protein
MVLPLQSAASRYLRDVPAGNFDNAMFYMNDHSVRKWEAVTTGILGQFLLRGVSSMRPVLWGLLGLVVCLPLVFVLLIVTAAKYSAMDSFTIKLPADIQTTVADLIMQKVGYGKDSAKGIDRALRFDPENADAWTRRCHDNLDGTTSDPATCRKAIALRPTAWNFNGLGAAQEKAKDFCAAEDSYTNAIKEATNEAYYLRNMGALPCDAATPAQASQALKSPKASMQRRPPIPTMMETRRTICYWTANISQSPTTARTRLPKPPPCAPKPIQTGRPATAN